MDQLLEFLDGIDADPDLEDAADDDDELDDDRENEPSLGSHETPTGTSYAFKVSIDGNVDAEGDEHDGREPDVDDEPSLCGINADCRTCDDRDREADLGSFDRMMDQTRATLIRSGWHTEGGEVDPT